MSLIDDWIARGASSADKALTEHGEERISDLLTRLEGLLPASGGTDAHAATLRGMSIDAIGRLRAHAPALVGATRHSLATSMTFLAVGDQDGALNAYLRDRATPDDLVRSSLVSSMAAINERTQRDAAFEAWKQLGMKLLQEVGPIAARYLLPLLLRA